MAEGMKASSRFYGTWALVPERSSFALDRPPSAALSRVMPQADGLFMSVAWVDADGKKGMVEHVLRYDGPTLVMGTEVTLRVLDERTLETVVHKDGDPVSTTRRTLQQDETLELRQELYLPGGRKALNVSVYRRHSAD